MMPPVGPGLNEGRAFGWLNSLRKREIKWQAASTQITEYLKSRNASDARIKEQLDRASKYLRPWLRDQEAFIGWTIAPNCEPQLAISTLNSHLVPAKYLVLYDFGEATKPRDSEI